MFYPAGKVCCPYPEVRVLKNDVMQKLTAMQNGASDEKMMEMIKNIPGIKIETIEKVNVKF